MQCSPEHNCSLLCYIHTFMNSAKNGQVSKQNRRQTSVNFHYKQQGAASGLIKAEPSVQLANNWQHHLPSFCWRWFRSWESGVTQPYRMQTAILSSEVRTQRHGTQITCIGPKRVTMLLTVGFVLGAVNMRGQTARLHATTHYEAKRQQTLKVPGSNLDWSTHYPNSLSSLHKVS
jgi:hypothetical protein